MKIVISLGGSLIINKGINYNFLRRFKFVMNKLEKSHKIVIVTGGGSIAREYINALRQSGLSEERCSLIGIKATKLNAMFISNFLNKNKIIPDSLQDVRKYLKHYNTVICGALGYHPKMTSDGDAAMIAGHIHADMFINMTNVSGLFTSNPKTNKNAKFIPKISFDDFYKMANRIKYKAGQHFVLDQSASGIIKKYRIKTIILQGTKNLERAVKKQRFRGTVIS